MLCTAARRVTHDLSRPCVLEAHDDLIHVHRRPGHRTIWTENEENTVHLPATPPADEPSEIHAHIDSRSVDCDGPLDRSHVMTMNDTERADEQFGDIKFRNRVVAYVVNARPLSTGNLTVSTFEDGTSRLSWFEPTDEGCHAVDALFCVDDCDLEARSQRDHFAERMGF